jgi:competence protein ComEA
VQPTPTTRTTRQSRDRVDEDFPSPEAERGKRLLGIDQNQGAGADAHFDGDDRRFFFTWDARARKAALILLGALALVIAWWWFSGQPREMTPVEIGVTEGGSVTGTSSGMTAAAPAQVDTVVVHVVGKVAEPGVVELPAGSRVQDAVEAAGGAVKDKALESVNLARVLVDGEQIDVGATTTESGSTRISLNSSDAGQLQELPGVGPVIAERIVEWRTANGPFRSVEELSEVSGIGPAMVERIRDEVGM